MNIRFKKEYIVIKRLKIQSFIVEVVTFTFFALFLYAAASKLFDYKNTEIQMSKSPIITDFASLFVWLIPVLEIIIATLLIINRTIILGLYAAFALMVLFTLYILAILNYSDFIPCSCGGILQGMGWRDHLIFNVFFIVISLIGIFLQSNILDKKG